MKNPAVNNCKINELLERALLLDLEVGPHGDILKTGAVLHDRTFFRGGGIDRGRALRDLAEFASTAEVLVGHNLLEHDLAVLKEHSPENALVRVPVIDTLILSQICFPQNPYHRLVKDYKLVRESVNDPVADAKLCGVVFRDEIAALEAMRENPSISSRANHREYALLGLENINLGFPGAFILSIMKFTPLCGGYNPAQHLPSSLTNMASPSRMMRD